MKHIMIMKKRINQKKINHIKGIKIPTLKSIIKNLLKNQRRWKNVYIKVK